ncbi:MAG: hypothetical protein NC390_05135 [Fusobacterium sp.]|nr:hypothetical protein [Fusobacterium sp.]
MQIRNNTQIQKNVPSFGGGGEFLNRLTQVLPDTKVSKGLTQLDKNCFQGYVYSMKFKLGTTHEEIKALTKLQGEDFVNGAYELLAKKMGIPDEIKPSLIPQAQSTTAPMAYMFNYNAITRNQDLSSMSQAEIFSGLRHELQHFKQNMDVFRHETLGEKVVDIHVNGLVNTEKATVKHLLANMSLDEMVEQGIIQNQVVYDTMARYQKYFENNDMAALDKEIEALVPEFRQQVTAFRQKVVDSMGIIKSGTKEAQKAERYFEDFQNIDYFECDGKIDYAKYFASGIEQEALLAGERAGFEFSGEGCMVKFAKDKFKTAAALQDAEVKKLFDDLAKAEV